MPIVSLFHLHTCLHMSQITSNNNYIHTYAVGMYLYVVQSMYDKYDVIIPYIHDAQVGRASKLQMFFQLSY